MTTPSSIPPPRPSAKCLMNNGNRQISVDTKVIPGISHPRQSPFAANQTRAKTRFWSFHLSGRDCALLGAELFCASRNRLPTQVKRKTEHGRKITT